ncbi:MAG: methyltransferase domain-containing protein [Actinomycetota bacterium]
MDPRHETLFPTGFFGRADERPDAEFYAFDRLVTHIDDRAIAAVGELYVELDLTGDGSGAVLDICSSWISHFPEPPERLVVTGMNERELAANIAADERHVGDLNEQPVLPGTDGEFAAVTCCVSVDYLTRPLDVFAEAARVLVDGGVFVCTFSNRCFPTKAINGWLGTDDTGRCRIVETYFELTDGFEAPITELRTPAGPGDPLFAVRAHRTARTA